MNSDVGMNGSIPLQATVVASQNQVSCELAGEAVILNLEDGVYYGLNPVAARVWELVRNPRRLEEIRDVLVSEYEIEETTCTRDLLELVSQLREWKLVELRNGKPSSD